MKSGSFDLIPTKPTSKLATWNGTAQQQQNGTQPLTAPPGVPTPANPPAGAGPPYSTGDGTLNSATQASATAIAAPQTPAQQILMSAADRWGLLGLLAAIKNADADQNLLSIGTDLGTMGLDMQTH